MKWVPLKLFDTPCRCWIGLGLCLALLAGFESTHSHAADLKIDIGFESQSKVGCWTPVRVESSLANAESCEVEAIDPDGVQVVYPLMRTSARHCVAEWTGTFRSGRLDANVVIRLRDGEGRLVDERRLPSPTDGSPGVMFLRQSIHRWLELGFNTPLVDDSPQRHIVRSAEWPKAVEISGALDGIDGILLSSRVPMNEPIAAEVQRWLRRSGQVVLSVTTDREEFQKTLWSEWLRGAVDVRERTRTSDLSGVESFTVFSRKIPAAKLTPVTIFDVKEGRKLASCLEGPLLMRASFGFGQVTLIGVDLAQPPLSRWEGRPTLLKRLLFRSNDAANAKSSEGTRLSQSGITDLASQWRAAVIEIPGVTRPSLWGVLGLLLAYGLLIGPLDFVVVHKLLRRPQWTWFTLPILVGAASLCTLWIAREMNGDTQQLTQLDVVDVDVNRQEVISRSWATAYSEKNQRCRVEAVARQSKDLPNFATTAAQVSWLGFPETGPGGMYRPSGFDLGHSGYRSSVDRQILDDIPLGQWSSKSFTSEARWVMPQPLVECRLTTSSANELSGQIVHHFPFALQDWVVAFEGRIFVPQPTAGEKATKWEPNQPWIPTSADVYGREMRGLLTRTKRTKIATKSMKTSEDILIEQERYDPLDLDSGDILQMMTLHEAAGGKAYTGLDHASLRAFDVTPLISLDRAVLIARIPESQTEWRLNGEARKPTRHHAYVRLLLPVKREQLDASGLRVLPKFDNVEVVPETKTEPKETPNNTPAPSETKSP